MDDARVQRLQDRRDSITKELSGDDVDEERKQTLNEELKTVEDKLEAVRAFDQNEKNNMSTPPEVIGKEPEPEPETEKEPEEPEKEPEKQPETEKEPEQEPEQETQEPEKETQETDPAMSGIRTTIIPDVNVTNPPSQAPSSNDTGPPVQALRTLQRQPYSYLSRQGGAYAYPPRAYDSNQVGLVTQGYRSYYGM